MNKIEMTAFVQPPIILVNWPAKDWGAELVGLSRCRPGDEWNLGIGIFVAMITMDRHLSSSEREAAMELVGGEYTQLGITMNTDDLAALMHRRMQFNRAYEASLGVKVSVDEANNLARNMLGIRRIGDKATSLDLLKRVARSGFSRPSKAQLAEQFAKLLMDEVGFSVRVGSSVKVGA